MRKFLLVSFLIVGMLIPSALGLTSSIKSSCTEDEAAMISVNSTSGGHIAEPEYYGNKVCIKGENEFNVRQNCLQYETSVFSMFNKTNSHFTIYDGYNYEVCSENTGAVVRSSCLSNETAVLSLYSSNNSHVASPGTSGFNNQLCLYSKKPSNITLTMTGISSSSTTYTDDQQVVSSGETVTAPLAYPYITTNQPLGIISYGGFVKLSREDSTTISVTQTDNTFLLPFTKGSTAELEDQQNDVTSRRFLNLIKPSFSYFLPEKPAVRVAYNSDLKVKGFRDVLTNNVKITVRHGGVENGKPVIIMKGQ